MNMKKGKTIRIPLLGDMVVSLYRTLIGIALGLVASGILIAISGVNPFTAYGALIKGAFGSKYAISNVLVRSSPLLLGGIGFVLILRCHCCSASCARGTRTVRLTASSARSER